MDFPVVGHGESSYPKDLTVCPIDGNPITEEFVHLDGGALMEYTPGKYIASDFMGGYLLTAWHADHSRPKTPANEYTGAGSHVDVIETSHGGQFHLRFCSTKCLRVFLNELVDELEGKIKKQKMIDQRVTTRMMNAAAKAAKPARKKPGPKPKVLVEKKKTGQPTKTRAAEEPI